MNTFVIFGFFFGAGKTYLKHISLQNYYIKITSFV